MGPRYDSNLKNKDFTFILNLYLLTESEDSLNYSLERNHIGGKSKQFTCSVGYVYA